MVTRGLRRFHESGQSHFITFSCYRRQAKLARPATRDLFLATLEAMRVQFGACVYGYVVMPEHIHLLINEPERGSVAEALHFLKLSCAKRAKTTAENIAGSFWQKRYYDMNIRNYRQFVEKLRYIHRNPVKRGLCASPADWQWSNFRHYAFRERGPVEIESEWTARDREHAALGLPPGRRKFLIPG